MDSLPLELVQKIISHLVTPLPPFNEVVRAPVIKRAERFDICNVRLTSRWLQAASLGALAEIVENTIFYCTEKSMNFLGTLTRNKELVHKINCLTIGGYDLSATEDITTYTGLLKPNELLVVSEERGQWAEKHLLQSLTGIFDQLPQLYRLRCIPIVRVEPFDWSSYNSLAEIENVIREKMLTLPSPEKYIRNAMQASHREKDLQDFALLTQIMPRYDDFNANLSTHEGAETHHYNLAATSPLSPHFSPKRPYPNLRHLTVDVCMSYFNPQADPSFDYPHLDTLHLIFSSPSDGPASLIRRLAMIEPQELTLSYSYQPGKHVFSIERDIASSFALSTFKRRRTQLDKLVIRRPCPCNLQEGSFNSDVPLNSLHTYVVTLKTQDLYKMDGSGEHSSIDGFVEADFGALNDMYFDRVSG